MALRALLLPRLHDLAVQPHVLQHRLAAVLGGVLDAVVEEALGFGEVLVLAGGLPEVVAGFRRVGCLVRFVKGSLGRSGIAARPAAAETVATGEGSRYSMSPEQLAGDEVGPETDIYSLGLLAFGGPRSFRAGGWAASGLEQLLPLSSRPPTRRGCGST